MLVLVLVLVLMLMLMPDAGAGTSVLSEAMKMICKEYTPEDQNKASIDKKVAEDPLEQAIACTSETQLSLSHAFVTDIATISEDKSIAAPSI